MPRKPSFTQRLITCLQAHEDHRSMQRDLEHGLGLIHADDPRYTPIIGEWNTFQAPETRWSLFHEERRAMRRALLAEAKAKAGKKGKKA